MASFFYFLKSKSGYIITGGDSVRNIVVQNIILLITNIITLSLVFYLCYDNYKLRDMLRGMGHGFYNSGSKHRGIWHKLLLSIQVKKVSESKEEINEEV